MRAFWATLQLLQQPVSALVSGLLEMQRGWWRPGWWSVLLHLNHILAQRRPSKRAGMDAHGLHQLKAELRRQHNSLRIVLKHFSAAIHFMKRSSGCNILQPLVHHRLII